MLRSRLTIGIAVVAQPGGDTPRGRDGFVGLHRQPPTHAGRTLEDFPLLAHVASEISRDLGVELRPARRQGDDIVWLSAGCTNQDPSMLFMPIAFQHPVPSQEVPFAVLLTKVRFESLQNHHLVVGKRFRATP
jgi:hypothetical protein